MTTEEFFAERKARADREAFRRILDREGGEPPRPGDGLPPELAHLPPGGFGHLHGEPAIYRAAHAFEQGVGWRSLTA